MKVRPYGVLMAAPVAWGMSGVEDSVIKVCARCRADVHLAPVSQRMLATHPTIMILCVPCGEQAAASGHRFRVELMPEQQKEYDDARARRRRN